MSDFTSSSWVWLRSCPTLGAIALQLFMWEWSKAGASPSDFDSDAEHAWSPLVVHKTRRSLRAVHFHPHGAPLMLTAEVSIRMFVIQGSRLDMQQPHARSERHDAMASCLLSLAGRHLGVFSFTSSPHGVLV